MTAHIDTAACRALWRWVLASGLRDALGLAAAGHDKASPVAIRNNARAWIGSRDFHMVCALAGEDGSRVEARYRRTLGRLWKGEITSRDLGLQNGLDNGRRRVA